ncbi:MAG TPA: tyrosine/phenylalanine carboxypeptidase domain-containing protein [Candidatus Saccharimonadales bacterium]|nr:tyrosine/phenylalanine carboxypeptidase domain-containing protein [Candidatus Saccharimonadales bacterium]
MNRPEITRRHEALLSQLESAKSEHSPELAAFIGRRLRETDLLLCFLDLREDPTGAQAYARYRQLVGELYGSFDAQIVQGVLGYLKDQAARTNTMQQYEEVVSAINVKPAQGMYRPSPEDFQYYRQLLLTSDHPLRQLAEQPLPDDYRDRTAILGLFEWALQTVGAKAEEWRLREKPHGSNVMISRHKQEVILGDHYTPHTAERLRQIVGHEVCIHVRRVLLQQHHQSAQTEEGVALLAEQLLAPQFGYKRLVRYLAGALAWGVDGKPRTFSETFAIVWRVFMIIAKTNEQEAKQRAFKECVRIFRGGIPEVPGAAFIKDKVYLEANLTVWQGLSRDKLNQAEFLRLLDGYQ